MKRVLIILFVCCSSAVMGVAQQAVAEPTIADKLQANLWVEIAPEYRANCFQAFNAALDTLKRRVEFAPRIDGRPVGPDGRPLAVVADLDETILDNSGYNSGLAARGQTYSPESWAAWVVDHGDAVGFVPGAERFIREAEALGLTLIYISNRREVRRSSTIATMARLGIDTDRQDPWLLLRTVSSDKTARRQIAQSHYHPVAYLGDNLGDFPIEGHSAEDAQDLWGRSWFMFPNPVYGSWETPLRGRDPKRALQEWLDQGR